MDSIAGKTAFNAVKKISRGLLSKWWRTPSKYVNGSCWIDYLKPEIQKTMKIDGNSLTLGLALSMLMAGTSSKETNVIATGNLDVGVDANGTLPGSGIRVTPISCLTQKFEAVEQWARKYQPKSPIKFLVPLQNCKGNDNKVIGDSICRDTFKTLLCSGHNNWKSRLANVGVTLIAVETLLEAMALVGAKNIRPNTVDYIIQGISVVSILALLGSAIYVKKQADFAHWRNEPIVGGMSFQPLTGKERTSNRTLSLDTPLRYANNDLSTARPLCGKSALVTGEQLFVYVQIGNGSQSETYWPTVLAVPEYLTPDKTHDSYNPHDNCGKTPVVSGGLWCQTVSTVPGEAEDMAVMVIADRYADIAADLDREMATIRKEYDSTNNGAPIRLKLSEIVNRFRSLYKGRMTDQIVRLVRAEECVP